jgi:nucleoside 2-deoxyribosyltransferase
MIIYLASPLGFSNQYDHYRERIKEHLQTQGHDIFDPWDQESVEKVVAEAQSMDNIAQQKNAILQAASFAGRINAEGIESCDSVLAVLDGAEVDSGTASEVGYGAGLGKICFGLRTDRRDSGDLPGLPINLQVLHFITSTGGQLFRSIDEIDIFTPMANNSIPPGVAYVSWDTCESIYDIGSMGEFTAGPD